MITEQRGILDEQEWEAKVLEAQEHIVENVASKNAWLGEGHQGLNP